MQAVFLLPVNNRLFTFRDAGAKAADSADEVVHLLTKWDRLHWVRVALTFTGFGIAIADAVGLFTF